MVGGLGWLVDGGLSWLWWFWLVVLVLVGCGSLDWLVGELSWVFGGFGCCSYWCFSVGCCGDFCFKRCLLKRWLLLEVVLLANLRHQDSCCRRRVHWGCRQRGNWRQESHHGGWQRERKGKILSTASPRPSLFPACFHP